MHRIDTTGRALSLFGDGRDGFKPGDPLTGEQATRLDPDFFNGLQENLCRAIEAAGLVLVKGDHTQLTEAIRRLTATAHVLQPRNLTPAVGSTGIGEVPTLTGSPYYSLYGVAQAGARFEVSRSETFATILHTGTVTGAGTSYTVPAGVLTTNTVNFWRVSYKDAEGRWSLASAPTGFTTGAIFQYLAQPTITAPANNAAGVSTTPTITFSAFSVVGGTDTHAATQVQIATDAAFANIIHDSGTGQPGTAYTVPSNAALPTLYVVYIRMRHKGANLGWSEWSTAVRVQVQAKPSAPVNVSPAAGATGVALAGPLQCSSFVVSGGTDTHVATRWQIATDAAFANIIHDSGDSASLLSYTIPAGAGLQPLTLYYWRCGHKGSATGYGPWSTPTSFAPKVAYGYVLLTTVGTHSGTYPAGVTQVRVKVVGGGGPNGPELDYHDGRDNGDGGGGGIAIRELAVTAGASWTAVVGAAGVYPAAGGSSSFSGLLTATGGGAGAADTAGGAYGVSGQGYGGGTNSAWVEALATIGGVPYGRPGVSRWAWNDGPAKAGVVFIEWGY